MTNTELEDLSRAVTGLHVYVADQADVPTTRGSAGMTHPRLDLACRSALEASNRWRGRQPAVALNRTVIAKCAEERAFTPDERPAEERSLVLAVLAHELAHVLLRKPPYIGVDIPDDLQDRAGHIVRLAITLSNEEASSPSGPHWPDWWGHDHRWMRLALHIGYRIGRLKGVALHWRQIVGYLDSLPVCLLCAALDDEPRRLRRLSLDDVMARSMPRLFRRTWAEVYAADRSEQDQPAHALIKEKNE